jgi:hypothetical protein
MSIIIGDKEMKIIMTAYQDFIQNGGKESDWPAHAERLNAISRENGVKTIINLWKTSGVSGNAIVNLFRQKDITIPDKIKMTLQNDDTEISSTSVTGRGISKFTAKKIFTFVSNTINTFYKGL